MSLMLNYATTGCPKFTLKTTYSPSTIATSSNTPIPRPTPLTIPNGIRIQSAILPQYIDRWDRRQVYAISAYSHYTDIEQRTKNKKTKNAPELIILSHNYYLK